MMKESLSGITVLALEQAVAAPLATRQLADLGARVIKIERRGNGDFARSYDTTVKGSSSAFVWLNRGKESVTLDYKTEEGSRILESLLQSADIFIHNISPSAARRAGLDIETLHQRHPRLIPCSVSGYAHDGPNADMRAYDLLIQAETGLLSITGDGPHMAKVGISIADIAAGTYAHAGILSALFHRERTGESVPVRVTLFDSLMEWMSYPLYYTRYGGVQPPRTGTMHATIAPYGAFASAGGDMVLMAVQNEPEWVRFCELVLEQPALLDDPRFATPETRVSNRGVLDRLIAEQFAAASSRVISQRLAVAGIAHAPLNDLSDLPSHPEIQDRNRWIQTPTPDGVAETLLPPGMAAGPDGLGAVPALGAHTVAILGELGYGPTDIDDLYDRGVV